MQKFLTRLTISIISLCSISSCGKPDIPFPKGPLPEWEVQIPTKKADVISWLGLYDIYKYGDILVAHTSFYTDPAAEDNRLCGINEKTGEVEWFFPADTTKRYDYLFDSKAYQYKNLLFFKYSDNDPRPLKRTYTTCFDIVTQKETWKIEDNASGEHIVYGVDNKCYFSNSSDELYCMNLDDLSMTKIFESDTTSISDMIVSKDNKYIIISHYRTVVADNKNYYYVKAFITVLDSENNSLVLNKEISPSGYYYLSLSPTLFEYEGIVYVNINTYIAALNIQKNYIVWERYDDGMYMKRDMNNYNDIIFKSGINAISGYNSKTGERMYFHDFFGTMYSNCYGRFQYAIDSGLNLRIFDIETGKTLSIVKPKYKYRGDYFFGSNPTKIGDKLYIMGKKHLYRYSVKDLIDQG